MIADVTIHLSNETIQVLWFFAGIIFGGVFGVAFERNAKETQTLWHKVKK
jgi:hypothetical protein